MLFGLTNSKRVKRCCLVENPRTGEKIVTSTRLSQQPYGRQGSRVGWVIFDDETWLRLQWHSPAGIVKHLCRVEAEGSFCHVLFAILFNLALEVSPGLAFQQC